MSLSEFSIIEKYFMRRATTRRDVSLGIGDDAAILDVPDGLQLVTTTDTLIEDIHFPAETNPGAIGYKSLAVNLSDLAAMGAEPAWVTLSLSLPDAREDWLDAFSNDFLDLCEKSGVQLVGGDTVSGPLVITVQVMGFVPAGKALRRDAAKPGDRIFVTGTLGDAALALRLRKEQETALSGYTELLRRLEYPEPHVSYGIALRDIANAVIDISDGLAADLGHILARSGVGATIHIDQIPVSHALQVCCNQLGLTQIDGRVPELVLAGGDDYELCFTVPEDRIENLRALERFALAVTEIGVIEPMEGLRCVAADGEPVALQRFGYQHFSE